MLVRIVRMTVQEDKLSDFHLIFDGAKQQIKAFPGNYHLELLRDHNQQNVRLTYSLWKSPEALEEYRQSEFFRKTWTSLKTVFSERATAFSIEKLESIEKMEEVVC